jgi:hypothetical protein
VFRLGKKSVQSVEESAEGFDRDAMVLRADTRGEIRRNADIEGQGVIGQYGSVLHLDLPPVAVNRSRR